MQVIGAGLPIEAHRDSVHIAIDVVDPLHDREQRVGRRAAAELARVRIKLAINGERALSNALSLR